MSETEILDEIDKLRRENGWKPRRRMSNNKADKAGHENSDKQVDPHVITISAAALNVNYAALNASTAAVEDNTTTINHTRPAASINS